METGNNRRFSLWATSPAYSAQNGEVGCPDRPMITADRVLPAVVEPFMRPRIFASAAFSAACSAAFALAADPLPPIGGPSKPIQVPNAGPVAPSTLPPVRTLEKTSQEKTEPNKLPIVPPPRSPGEPAPKASDAPLPTVESHLEMPCLPTTKSICDEHLGPWNTVWARGGYNALWIRQAPASVPLLTSNGTILAGNSQTSFGAFNGMSVEGGMWLNQRHTLGIGASGFIAEKRSTVTAFTSDALGNPLLTRPFYNAQIGGTNGADSLIVSAPGRFTGSFAYEQGARVDGFDVFGLMNIVNNDKLTLNFSVGFRYFDLDEYATTYQVTQSLNGNTIPYFGGMVSGVAITDRIRTRNQFYGGQFGGDLEYRLGPVFLDLGAKAALGPVHQVTQVQGITEVPGVSSGPGGFLAVGNVPNGNQGNINTNNFAVLADVNALIGVQISSHFRLGFGYQFLYLNNVARPSSQFVSNIDPRLVPTSLSFNGRTQSNTANGGPGTPPNSPYDRDDFFLHGLRVMIELQY
jgi:hypothetical protein